MASRQITGRITVTSTYEMMIVCSIILPSFIHNIHNRGQNLLQNVVLTQFISLCIAYAFLALSTIRFGGIVWSVLWSIFFAVGLFMLYFYFVLRMKHCFDGSVYAIPKYILYIHYSISVIVSLCALAFGILIGVGRFWFGALSILIYALFAVTGIIQMVYSFNTKLFHLIFEQRQSIISRDDQLDTELNERQLKMIQVVTKQTVLITVPIIYALILVLFLLIILPIIGFQEIRSVGWAVVILMMMASLSAYLSFTKMQTAYDGMCGNCDSCMGKCCEILAERKLRDRI